MMVFKDHTVKQFLWLSLPVVFVGLLLALVGTAAFGDDLAEIQRLEKQKEFVNSSIGLEDQAAHAREAEAFALGAIADDGARQSLIAALNERGPDVDLASTLGLQQLDEPLRELILQTLAGSQQAKEKLVIRNDPRALDPLVKALGNWDPAVIQAASKTLKALGSKEVVDLLIKALEDLNPTLRREGVGILEAIGDQRAGDPLIQTLGDSDAGVREAAAQALGEIGVTRARDSLFSALGDEYSDVRLAAAQALERLDEPLGGLIRQTLSGSQQAMEQLVTRNDPRSFPAFVKALGNWDPAVRRAASETLKALGSKEIVDLLIKALEDMNPTIRLKATWILFAIADQRTKKGPVIQALGDEDPMVRRAAAWTLGRIEAREATDSLIHSLGDSEPGVRKAAAWVLGKFGDQRAVESLIKALGDRNSDVRENAAISLGKLGDQRAVEPLVQALGDESLKMLQAVALALGKIGDRRAVGPLVEALASRSSGVRKAAAEALESLGEPLGRLIEETLKGSPEAIQDLVSRKDPRTFDPLNQALWDPDSDVRRAAARSLGGINDARAVDGLVRMASSWNLLDRFVSTTALVKIDQEGFSDYVFVAFKVLTHPASVVYLLSVLLLVFVTHKTARWVVHVDCWQVINKKIPTAKTYDA